MSTEEISLAVSEQLRFLHRRQANLEVASDRLAEVGHPLPHLGGKLSVELDPLGSAVLLVERLPDGPDHGRFRMILVAGDRAELFTQDGLDAIRDHQQIRRELSNPAFLLG